MRYCFTYLFVCYMFRMSKPSQLLGYQTPSQFMPGISSASSICPYAPLRNKSDSHNIAESNKMSKQF